MTTGAVLRHSARDAILIALAGVHGALLLTVPSIPLIAIGMWWNANTVSHNFIHLPFFTSRRANAAFSAYLSLLLGVPQTLWRDRHLAHHADREWRFRRSARMGFECTLVAALWIGLALAGHGLLLTWAAGTAIGLTLCSLQGRYEHVRGTVSHYGRLYNFAFFNDGYHVEHHARPTTHWTRLAHGDRADVAPSRWPAVLRWLEVGHLDALERLVLLVPALQRFVVARHVSAFSRVLASLPSVRRVSVIGGGLFPRTVLVLRRLIPEAEITVIDRSRENLERARPFFGDGVRVIEAEYAPELCHDADLVIVPLAFTGDRTQFYRNPPARAVAVHDWVWNRHARGWVVSLLLLKRLNLVAR